MFKAPPFQPQIKTSKFHGAGLFILFAIPILALLGLFGRTEEPVGASLGTDIEISGTYPTRSRVGQTEHFNLIIANRSARPAKVTITFERDYLNQFSDLSFLPDVDRPYVIELKEVAPHSEQVARVELKSDHIGRHQSQIIVSGASQEAHIPVQTWVFP